MKTFPAKAQRHKEDKCLSWRLSLRLCAFAGVILLLAFNVVAQTPDTPAQLRVYLDTGRYTELETTAKRLLQKSPEAGAARYELAEALAATGRYTEAIAEFERAA